MERGRRKGDGWRGKVGRGEEGKERREGQGREMAKRGRGKREGKGKVGEGKEEVFASVKIKSWVRPCHLCHLYISSSVQHVLVFHQHYNVVFSIDGCNCEQRCFSETVQHCKWTGMKHVSLAYICIDLQNRSNRVETSACSVYMVWVRK